MKIHQKISALKKDKVTLEPVMCSLIAGLEKGEKTDAKRGRKAYCPK